MLLVEVCFMCYVKPKTVFYHVVAKAYISKIKVFKYCICVYVFLPVCVCSQAVVHETEGLLGYIYCDFFHRTNKPHQVCTHALIYIIFTSSCWFLL